MARPEGNGPEEGRGRACRYCRWRRWVGQVTGLGAAEEKPRKWGRVGVGGVSLGPRIKGAGRLEIREMVQGSREVRVGEMFEGEDQILGQSGKLRNHCRRFGSGGRQSFWARLVGM